METNDTWARRTLLALIRKLLALTARGIRL